MNLVCLVEEPSMKEVLNVLLPKILPPEITIIVIPHDGKKDLQHSIPIKLKNWNIPDSRFLIVQDQDNKDCIELKKMLTDLCDPCGKKYLVRIACQELESWYFGDLQAVSDAYGCDLTYFQAKSKYRIPDRINNPKEELQKLIPGHQQITGAKKIAPHMEISRNSSKSFQVLVDGVRKLIDDREVMQ